MVSRNSRFLLLVLLSVFLVNFYILLISGAPDAIKRAKVTVFYESKCPDSRRFFNQQLLPTFAKLHKYLDLDLVPFGKARVVPPNKMICQHGNLECDYNRLFACIQKYERAKPMQVIKTIDCIFMERESDEECITRFNDSATNYQTIQACRTANESYDMMREFEQKTGRLDYVPTLLLNDQETEDIQQGLETNMFEYLCMKAFAGAQIDECAAGSATNSTSPSSGPLSTSGDNKPSFLEELSARLG